MIIGGGLLGRLIALQLRRSGYGVVLYDAAGRDGSNAAAYVAAAMLSPMAEAVDATPLVLSLGRQSMALWREIVPTLPEKVFMQENGTLVVWHSQDRDLPVRFAAQLRHGYNGAEPWQVWDKAQIAAAEPQLAERFAQGFFLLGEGQLDNRQTLSALAAALEKEGVVCHWHTEAEPAAFSGSRVIDCRGIGAKNTWNLQAAAKLRGIRGEVARVFAPEITLNRPVRLLHPRYPLYIAPKENHIFVIGATQIESEDTSNVSVRSALELMSAFYAVDPAFGEARVLEFASRLRPTLSHHDPEIRIHPQKNLMEVNGLYRHGFMIAPAVAAAAARFFRQWESGAELPEKDEISAMPCRVAA